MVKRVLLILIVLGVSLASSEKLRVRRLVLMIGVKGNLYIKNGEVYFGVGGEVIFPLPKRFSIRADFINLNIHKDWDSLSFNQESFDLFYNLKFRNPVPYLYGGIGFYTYDGNINYGLRFGGGLNFRIAPLTRGFGEVGGVLEGNGEITPKLKLSLGVRYGRK